MFNVFKTCVAAAAQNAGTGADNQRKNGNGSRYHFKILGWNYGPKIIKSFFLSLLVASFFFIGCEDSEEKPIPSDGEEEQSNLPPDNDSETVTLIVEKLDQLESILTDAVTAINDPNVSVVELDMNLIGRLTMGTTESAAIEALITQLADAATQRNKALSVALPEIVIAGNVKLPYSFYVAAKSLIVIEQYGQLHFIGGIPTSANLNIVPFDDWEAPFYPITADRIDIDNDGMTEDGWQIFDIVKSDTVNALPNKDNNQFHRGLGRNVIGKTRSDRKILFINAQHVQLEENSHIEMRQLEYPDETNDRASLRFREIPRMANWHSDTIHMGGRWTDLYYPEPEFHRHPDSWAHRLGDSHFTYNPATSKFNFFRKDGQSRDGIIIKVPKHQPGINDDYFIANPWEPGNMFAWVTAEEISEFLLGREREDINWCSCIHSTTPLVLAVPVYNNSSALPGQIIPNLIPESAPKLGWGDIFYYAGLRDYSLDLPVPWVTVKTR